MSFFGSIANSLADKVKRVAGVVPPYEVVEGTAQQFAKFVAVDYYYLHLLSIMPDKFLLHINYSSYVS